MVTAADRGAFLQDLLWRATDNSVSIFSLLKSGLQNAVKGSANGRQIVGTSGNGRSVSFSTPDFLKGMTADDYRSLWNDLWQIYQDALTILGLSQPTATDLTHDDDISAQMLLDDRLTAVYSTHVDHTLGRLPYGGTFATS